MADEACLQVRTIGGWDAPERVKRIRAILGVRRVDSPNGDSLTLVVAVDERSESIREEIGFLSGVSFVSQFGNYS